MWMNPYGEREGFINTITMIQSDFFITHPFFHTLLSVTKRQSLEFANVVTFAIRGFSVDGQHAFLQRAFESEFLVVGATLGIFFHECALDTADVGRDDFRQARGVRRAYGQGWHVLQADECPPLVGGD